MTCAIHVPTNEESLCLLGSPCSSSDQTLPSTTTLEVVHRDLIGGAMRIDGGLTVWLQ